MTSNHDFDNAMAFVARVIEIVSDPMAMAKLKMLKAETDGTLDWVRKFNPMPGYENAADKGTCPTCGKQYVFKGDQGGIRRHGQGKCYTDNQLAAEIVPAVLLIAQLSNNVEGNGNGAPSEDHV